MFVTLLDMPIEGMIPLKNMSDDYYILREEQFCVVGERRNKKFSLGDKIKARLITADIDTLRIDFAPADRR